MKTRQADARKSVRQILEVIETEKHWADFFFRHRHVWESEGGYDYCRERFRKHRRAVKSLRRLLERCSKRLVNLYAT